MEENSVTKASKNLVAEIIASNEDVISEILLRLPVKSLIRFKLVSKDWQSFISKPHFAKRHTQLSLRRNPDFLLPRGLFFNHPGNQYPEYVPCIRSSDTEKFDNFHSPSLSFLKLGSLVSVIHSCNGLLLCRFTSKSYYFEYCICNLTTREFSRVPQPPDDHPGSSPPTFSLVYNPLESPYYKIICLRDLYQTNYRKPSSHSAEILVYSSENSTWISKCCFKGFSIFENLKTPSAYWNGGLYWIRNYECYCLNLNAEEIKLKKIASPRNQEHSRVSYLGEWCGHLHAVRFRDNSKYDFQVLEFEEFSSEWFVKYTGSIARIISGFPEAMRKESRVRQGDEITITYYDFAILAMIRGDREEDSALVLAIPGKVISYNFTSETVEVIREMSKRMCFTENFCSFPYVETLSPV